ncbi:helix-turn-helix domain-containing protein [Chryseobacterium sp. MIQD13]|uniref:helix-turn-helix domain-containing protein n=1 Tax=Chryseobacterium sp. MIQD13 TaxID=3422310 RepID=UPI003D2D1CEA
MTMTLGTKLTRLRNNKGYTQQEIADKLQISQPAYSKWESDAVRPDLENLFKISNIYGIDLKELVDDAGHIISNNTFDSYSSNAIGTVYNATFNVHSAELIESVMSNQKDITQLLNNQNQLIEALIQKLKS